MQETEKEQNKSTTFPMRTACILFGAILLGVLLLVLGISLEISGLLYTGIFILPTAPFWGGFSLKYKSERVRVTLLTITGIVIVSGLLGVFSPSSHTLHLLSPLATIFILPPLNIPKQLNESCLIEKSKGI